ncbi:MAG: AAA family ATPase [Polyangiales bacterium]
MSGSGTDGLQIRLLGELEVLAHGKVVPLPQSRKTRALLGYLVLTGRAHRRERLCELLWDVADDPRAALRWSLSKLRELVDAPGQRRLVADREHAAVELRGVYVDTLEVTRLVGKTPCEAPSPQLEAARTLCRGELLEGLELTEFQAFHAFVLAERRHWRELHRQVLTTLLARSGQQPDKALPLVRELVELDPSDDTTRTQLLELLHATGRIREADEQSRANRRLLSQSLPPTVGGRPEPVASTPAVIGRPAPAVHAQVALPFVGRARERAQLQAALGAPKVGLRAVLVLGDAGVGKSRLLREEAQAAAVGGGRVLFASVPEPGPGWPYAVFRELLAKLTPAGPGDVSSDGLLERWLSGGLSLRAAEDRDSLWRVVLQRFEQAVRSSGPAPLWVVIDDVHWLDDASAELLHFLALGLRHVDCRVLLGARVGELHDRTRVAGVVRALRRAGLASELLLPPLDREETLALVMPLLPAAAVDAAAALFTQSAGNPLFALTLAREWQPERTTLPSSVVQLVRDRLEMLTPEQADVLRWAAVLGCELDVARLSELALLAPSQLVDTLELLARHGFLQLEARAADAVDSGASAFAHDLVRRAVYDQLSEPRRRLMHARIAQLLASGGDADGDEAAALAHHASLGGDPAMAVRACLSAGQRCLRWYANADALRLARNGLGYAKVLPEPERTTRAIELLDLSIRARRPPASEVMPQLAELSARARDLGAHDHARIGYYLQAYLMFEQGELADAHQFTREVQRLGEISSAHERIAALGDAARCLTSLERDLPSAEAYLLEAETISVPDAELPIVFPLARGSLAFYRGEYTRAEVALDDARRRAQRDGHRIEEFYALEQRIQLELTREQYPAALAFSEELLVLGERMRGGSEGAFARAQHALARYAAGAESTTASLDAALPALAREDAKRRCACLLVIAAELEATRGTWPSAVAHAREALRLALLMDRPTEHALSRAVLVLAERAGAIPEEPEQREALRKLLEQPLAAHARVRANHALDHVAGVRAHSPTASLRGNSTTRGRVR